MNESNYRRCQIIAVFLFVLFSLSSFIATAKAATFCVSSASELETALATAAGNGENDTVQVLQGNYFGNFIYASTEAFNISIEGGYSTNCFSRVLNASNTVMDGSNSESVLILSSNQIAAFKVDGLTLRNGTAQVIGPSGGTSGGGLKVLTNGSLTLTNCNVNNSSASSGGGVCVGPNSDAYTISVTLSNNTINDNSATYGGGVCAYGKGMINLSSNTISDNATAGGGSGAGGGVYLDGYYSDSTIILTNNTIKNNTANGSINGNWTGGIWVSAGGIYVDAQIIKLNGNTIRDNSAMSGSGGVFATATASITLINNIISDNNAGVGGGGGLFLYGFGTTATVTLTNNTIADNKANSDGGGLMIGSRQETAVANIYNNIIWNNNAATGADIYINNDSDADFLPTPVNLFNNLFDQSSQGAYIQRPFTIDPGNLDGVNPMFIGGGDYHLTADSACVDTGSNGAPSIPYFDFDGDKRIIDGDNDGNATADIGADEYVSTIKTIPATPWIPLLLGE